MMCVNFEFFDNDLLTSEQKCKCGESVFPAFDSFSGQVFFFFLNKKFIKIFLFDFWLDSRSKIVKVLFFNQNIPIVDKASTKS